MYPGLRSVKFNLPFIKTIKLSIIKLLIKELFFKLLFCYVISWNRYVMEEMELLTSLNSRAGPLLVLFLLKLGGGEFSNQ